MNKIEFDKRRLISLGLGFGLFVVLFLLVGTLSLFAYALVVYPDVMALIFAGGLSALLIIVLIGMAIVLMGKCGESLLEKISPS